MVIANWWARVRCGLGYHCASSRADLCASTHAWATTATARCVCGVCNVHYTAVWRLGRWVGWRQTGTSPIAPTIASAPVTATAEDTVWFDDLPAVTAERSA
jgi:hypothetical protein